MSIRQSFVLAIKSLATSKMRSLLTMLGIIIGVGAVIIIISLGDGMQAMMNESFESMGSNVISAQVWGRGTARSIGPDDMYQLVEDNKNVLKAVSPNVGVQTTAKYGTTDVETKITGVGEFYLDLKPWTMEDGRFLQYIDVLQQQKVCVIGKYVENEYLDGSGIGKQIRVGGNNFTVVGVLAEISDSGKNGDDNAVYIPYTTATRINGNATISAYEFASMGKEESTWARVAIENKLESVFQDTSAYNVMSMDELMKTLNDLQGTMITVLAAIAGISLLVGGIGIMNIMLVSVSERTREIGIRKSLGAKRRDIRSQFIIEAGTTSAIGGLIGIVVGVALAYLTGSLFDIKAVPSAMAISVAFGVSVGVGILFGYLPANKAASLNPIDALRYD